jgi:acyl carrier protein
MIMDEIRTSLADYITKEILRQPKRALKPDEALLSSGLVDSFHLVDLAIFVEDTFNVHLDDAELSTDTFDTLDQLAALIAARRS